MITNGQFSEPAQSTIVQMLFDASREVLPWMPYSDRCAWVQQMFEALSLADVVAFLTA